MIERPLGSVVPRMGSVSKLISTDCRQGMVKRIGVLVNDVSLDNVSDHRAGTSDHPFSKPRASPASRASHCYPRFFGGASAPIA